LVDTLNSNTTQIKKSDGEWSEDEDEVNFDAMNTEEEYSHAEIINQCDFGQRHLIDAHISSNTTLLQQEGLSTFTETVGQRHLIDAHISSNTTLLQQECTDLRDHKCNRPNVVGKDEDYCS
jgi:hypothetical protein